MKAKVVKSLDVFSGYDGWAHQYGYDIDFGQGPKNGEEYEIVCSGPHLGWNGTLYENSGLYEGHTLYGLLKENGKIYIMLDSGIEIKDTDDQGNYLLGLVL